MASIRKHVRKDGTESFYVLWRDQGSQTSRVFDEEVKAERFKDFLNANGQSLTLATQAARESAGSGPTVAELLAHHIAGRTGITSRTRADYERDVRLHLGPALGALKVKEITRRRLRDWINTMQSEGASAKSISNYHGLLSAAMTTAVEDGLRKDNPCRGIKLPEKDHRADREVFLEPEEYAVLLSHFPQHWKPLVELLAGTGMRWGEATALQVEDAMLDAKVPYLIVGKAWKRGADSIHYLDKPKTRRGFRDVTIDAGLAKTVRRLIEGRGPKDFILTSATIDAPVAYPNFMPNVWKLAVQRAMASGPANPTPLRYRPKIHNLRHSHGSWLIMEGVDILTVSRRLGHTSITTTMNIYGHLSLRTQKGAADAIGRAIGGAPPEPKKKKKKKPKPEADAA